MEDLIVLHNRYALNAVRKFVDRKTAEIRTAKVMKDAFVEIKHIIENPAISQPFKEKLQDKAAALTGQLTQALANAPPLEGDAPAAATEEKKELPDDHIPGFAKEAKKKAEKKAKEPPAKAPPLPKGKPSKIKVPGPKGKFSGKIIKVIAKESPYTKGSSREKSYALIKDGMTYEDFQVKVGKTNDLRYGLEKGHYQLVDAS
jgi:hypothetical protein